MLKNHTRSWKLTGSSLCLASSECLSLTAQAIQDDIILLTIGYFLIIIFIFICLWRNSKPYQKTHVTLAGLVAIGCGIATDFGLLSALGVKFNFVCQVLPFLLVGIGADNIFVLISGYFQQVCAN